MKRTLQDLPGSYKDRHRDCSYIYHFPPMDHMLVEGKPKNLLVKNTNKGKGRVIL